MVTHLGVRRAEDARGGRPSCSRRSACPTRSSGWSNYPHQLSGGLRQRVAIAVALAADPDVLVADEPTTALDVTIQAQILDLLERERKRRGMALILITHDLGVVASVTDRVLVMYAGRVVESGTTARDLRRPAPPLHARVAELDAAGRLAARARAADDPRLAAERLPRAPRLPVHAPLRFRDRRLPRTRIRRWSRSPPATKPPGRVPGRHPDRDSGADERDQRAAAGRRSTTWPSRSRSRRAAGG